MATLGAVLGAGLLGTSPASASNAVDRGRYPSELSCLHDGAARYGTGTPWSCLAVYPAGVQYDLWTSDIRYQDTGHIINYPAGTYPDLTYCSLAGISDASHNIRFGCVANGAAYTLLIAYPGPPIQ